MLLSCLSVYFIRLVDRFVNPDIPSFLNDENALAYSNLAKLLFVGTLIISFTRVKINFVENLRRQAEYILHWVALFVFNAVGPTLYSTDLVKMSYVLSVTLLLTSLINSMPFFKDTLKMQFQIYESWKFEDFIFFKGHFSKNNPKSFRNPIHAAWPIVLVATMSISVIGLCSNSKVEIKFSKFFIDVMSDSKRIPASPGQESIDQSDDYKIVRSIFLLSITAVGLFVIYNHALRTDYAKKWEILNKHHHDLLKIYAANISKKNMPEVDIAELQFAIDLLETNMWGHRSFRDIFSAILSKHYLSGSYANLLEDPKRVPRKELITRLHKDLLGKVI